MSASASGLRVIAGGADVIEHLSALLEKAKSGEIEGIATVICEKGGGAAVQASYREDIEYPWARLTAGAGWLYHHLMANGL